MTKDFIAPDGTGLTSSQKIRIWQPIGPTPLAETRPIKDRLLIDWACRTSRATGRARTRRAVPTQAERAFGPDDDCRAWTRQRRRMRRRGRGDRLRSRPLDLASAVVPRHARLVGVVALVRRACSPLRCALPSRPDPSPKKGRPRWPLAAASRYRCGVFFPIRGVGHPRRRSRGLALRSTCRMLAHFGVATCREIRRQQSHEPELN